MRQKLLLKKENLLVTVMLITLAVLTGCKKNTSAPADEKPVVTATGTPDGTAVTQNIGSGGGTIISSDGMMELVVPAGALGSNTDVTLQPITNKTPNGRGKAYRCLPDGLHFSKDVTLRFHYSAEELLSTDPKYMRLAFQTSDGYWQVIDKLINDTVAKTVSAPVNHFTDFSAFDVMRIDPPSRYLKKNETGTFKVLAVGMSVLNAVQLITAILEKPVTWKVNGVKGGNSTSGTIAVSNDDTYATYTAPGAIPPQNPVTVSAEIDFSFTVDGQTFNKGILTADVFITGSQYNVTIETILDLAIGTGEKFRVKDIGSFTVSLAGISGFVNNIQNSDPTFEKTANSSAGCNSTVERKGTGIVHFSDPGAFQVTVNPLDGAVYVFFGTQGGSIPPAIMISCPGVTPALNEIAITSLSGGSTSFKDTGQLQVMETGVTGQSIKFTITPLP